MKKSSQFMTQSQINDLLQSQDINFPQVSSNLNQAKKVEDKQGNEQYDEQFQSYNQSKNTIGIKNKSKQFETSYNSNHIAAKNKQLPSIKEQAINKNAGKSLSKKAKDTKVKQQKIYIPYNYQRLKERQRELLFTTITQENKKLKYELSIKIKQIETYKAKVNQLIENNAQQSATVKQKLLLKENQALKAKISKLQNIIQYKNQTNKIPIKLSKTQTKFIAQQEYFHRQHQLISIIDKLKQRLLHSEEQMKVVQMKMNEGLNFNDQLQRKLKRVQQLEYKIQKMTGQAQVDRQYISNLKDNIQKLEKVVNEQKKRSARLQIENKRQQLSVLTNNDIMQQLKQTKRQKQQLEKSLKELSSAMMSNVRKKINEDLKNKGQSIQDSNQILKT